jgi:hypothetical protein
VGLLAVREARYAGLVIHLTRPPLRWMFGSAGKRTRPAGCCEIRHGRVLGHHQLVARQAPLTHSQPLTQRRDSTPAGPDVPRVYVYELPPEFNTLLSYHKNHHVKGIHEMVPAALGAPGGDLLVGAVELMLHERLVSSSVRTLDPDEADFFYVPAWQRAAEGLGPTLDAGFVHEVWWPFQYPSGFVPYHDSVAHTLPQKQPT